MIQVPRLVETLVPINATPGTGAVDYATIGKGTTYASLLVLPLQRAIYPLENFNQVILNWTLVTMPTTATYVHVSPVSFRALLSDVREQTFTPGFADAAGVIRTAITRFSFDQLDNAGGYVTVQPYRLRKTAADSTVIGGAVQLGTRHAIPIAEGYLGFLTEHDGDDATGSHSLSVEIGWA